MSRTQHRFALAAGVLAAIAAIAVPSPQAGLRQPSTRTEQASVLPRPGLSDFGLFSDPALGVRPIGAAPLRRGVSDFGLLPTHTVVPTGPATAAANTAEGGFDWAAAGIGAAVVGGVVLLGSLVALSMSARRTGGPLRHA